MNTAIKKQVEFSVRFDFENFDLPCKSEKSFKSFLLADVVAFAQKKADSYRNCKAIVKTVK